MPTAETGPSGNAAIMQRDEVEGWAAMAHPSLDRKVAVVGEANEASSNSDNSLSRAFESDHVDAGGRRRTRGAVMHGCLRFAGTTPPGKSSMSNRFVGHQLAQEFQPLLRQITVEKIDSCQVAARPGEADDKSSLSLTTISCCSSAELLTR